MEDNNTQNDNQQQGSEAPTEPMQTADKELTKVSFDGYDFLFNPDMLDDVEVLEMIPDIESGKNIGALLEFLKRVLGDNGYESMKQYFVTKDGQFRITKLTQIFEALFEHFDPKA